MDGNYEYSTLWSLDFLTKQTTELYTGLWDESNLSLLVAMSSDSRYVAYFLERSVNESTLIVQDMTTLERLIDEDSPT